MRVFRIVNIYHTAIPDNFFIKLFNMLRGFFEKVFVEYQLR